MADLVEGVAIKMGGTEYIVPALNFRQLRELKAELEQLKVGTDGATQEIVFSAGLKVILAAVRRNYPDVTTENVEEWVDLRNFKEILPAILGMSGLVSKGGVGAEKQ